MPKLPGGETIQRAVPDDAYKAQSYRGGLAEEGMAKAAGLTAEGARKFADSSFELANSLLEERDRSEFATARSQFLQAKVAQDNAYDEDPDHGTWVQRYGQKMGEVQAAIGSTIQGNRARQLFNNQASLDVTQGTARLTDLARTKLRGEGQAAFLDSFNQNQQAFMKAPDDDTRDQLITAQRLLLQTARDSQFISPEASAQYEIQFAAAATKQRATLYEQRFDQSLDAASGRVYADPIKAPSEMSGLVNAIRGQNLPADVAEKLENRARQTLTLSEWQRRVDYDPDGTKARLQSGEAPGLDAEKRAILIRSADVQIERNITRYDHARRMASQDAENRTIAKIYGDDPSVTPISIARDPNMLPESKRVMIGLLEKYTKPEAPAAVSRQTTIDLFRRINLPADDPQKITDLMPIYKEFADGNMTRDDLNFTVKQFKDGASDDGSLLGKTKATFLKSVQSSIDRSNPMGGSVSPVGNRRYYEFMRDVDAMVALYRKNNKDPALLFDQRAPDYLGRPDVLTRYRPSMQEENAEAIDALAASRGRGPIAPPAGVPLTAINRPSLDEIAKGR